MLCLSHNKQLPDCYQGWRPLIRSVGLRCILLHLLTLCQAAQPKSPVLVPCTPAGDNHLLSADECKLPANGLQSVSWICFLLSRLDGAPVRQCMVETGASQKCGNNLCVQEHTQRWGQTCETRDFCFHYIHSAERKRAPYGLCSEDPAQILLFTYTIFTVEM